MKSLLLSSVIALASVVAVSVPSQAAPFHRHHHDCFVKTVKHKVHGHWVIRKERVCR